MQVADPTLTLSGDAFLEGAPNIVVHELSPRGHP